MTIGRIGARVRSEQKRQVAEQEALRRDEEAMEVASAQAQAAAAEEERELANMSPSAPRLSFWPRGRSVFHDVAP